MLNLVITAKLIKKIDVCQQFVLFFEKIPIFAFPICVNVNIFIAHSITVP